MTRDRIKRIYDLHAWVGVTCGLFVYVVSLSGVFALFGEEMHTWEDETLRIAVAEQPVPAMSVVSAFVREIATDGELLSVHVQLPAAPHPYYAASAAVRLPESGKVVQHVRRWHPNTGAALPDRGDGIVHWIVDFHRNLMLPRTLGRILVGLAGVFMLLLILSGLVTHRKMLREAFTWRLDRSVRLKWQDSHKALGLWGVPFHLMIAFTGAWLGLVVLLLPLIAAVSFKGDPGAVIAAVGAPPPVAAGVGAAMSSIDEAAEKVHRRTGVRPDAVAVDLWGDRNAVYRFFYRPPDRLVGHAEALVGAATGEIQSVRLAARPRLIHRILPAVTTLHYAQFGGLWMKLLYVLLGLASCVLTATGLMMWLERRLHGNAGRCPAAVYRALGRITVGVCAGMGLATFAIFHADKWVPIGPEDRSAMVGSAYFAVWAAAVLYAWCRRNEYRACKELLAVTAAAAFTIPATNAAATGQDLLDLFRTGHLYAAGVDAAAIAVAACLFLANGLIPSRRPVSYSRISMATPQQKSSPPCGGGFRRGVDAHGIRGIPTAADPPTLTLPHNGGGNLSFAAIGCVVFPNGWLAPTGCVNSIAGARLTRQKKRLTRPEKAIPGSPPPTTGPPTGGLRPRSSAPC